MPVSSYGLFSISHINFCELFSISHINILPVPSETLSSYDELSDWKRETTVVLTELPSARSGNMFFLWCLLFLF